MSRQRKQTTVPVPSELAIRRLRPWQSVRTDALETLAITLKRARNATGRKQRQVQAVAQQSGQEYMSETTVSRLEKPHVLKGAGDVGLMNVAYLTYLYGLDLSSVIRRMFAPLERHADALDEVQALAQRLSPERMQRVVELTRTLVDEQLVEDAEIGDGGYQETAHAWLDEVRTYFGRDVASAPHEDRAVDSAR
jgi:hypothetical protein